MIDPFGASTAPCHLCPPSGKFPCRVTMGSALGSIRRTPGAVVSAQKEQLTKISLVQCMPTITPPHIV